MTAFDERTAVGSVFEVSYPTLGVRKLASSAAIMTLAGVANGPSGVSWVENNDGRLSVQTAVGDGAQRTLTLPAPLYYLHETTDGFVGLDTDRSPPAAVMVIDQGGEAVFVPLTDVRGAVESVDVDLTGRNSVLLVSDGPGEDFRFVVRASGRTFDIRPPGRLIAEPFLDPRAESVYYEDHDNGTLVRILFATNTPSTVLEEGVSAVALSIHDVIAHTFVDPTRTDTFCFVEIE